MIDKIFEDSFQDFLAREADNISTGVSERNLCGRLAMYLESAKDKHGLHEYYSDTEYNRKQGGKVKTIINNDFEVIVINPDIILHSRGNVAKRDNLIVIEMKKSTRPEDEKESDRMRLIAMTSVPNVDVWSYDGEAFPEHVCGYELGVFIELDIGAKTFCVEKYKNGRLDVVANGNF